MRVTTKMFYDTFLSDMQKNMSSIFKANEQISSNKKVNRPSDDPAAMSRILAYKTQLSSNSDYGKAVDSAAANLEAIDSSLSNLSDLLIRAKELAMQGGNGIIDASKRGMLAAEVDQILQAAIGIANTRIGDKYIYSGFQSDSIPVDSTTGAYLRDSNDTEVAINPDVKVRTNMPASELFSDATTDFTAGPPAVYADANTHVLEALHALKAALQEPDDTLAAAAIQTAMGYLNNVGSHLSEKMADVGALLHRLDLESKYQQDRDYNLTLNLSRDQDADIAKAASELAQKQTALEALRTSSSKILQTSLFDFIS
jgi:flagellar hook-associated protein 3 FlgL